MAQGNMQLKYLFILLMLIQHQVLAGVPVMRGDALALIKKLDNSTAINKNKENVSVNCQIAVVLRTMRDDEEDVFLEVKFISDGKEAEISYAVLPKGKQNISMSISKPQKMLFIGENASLFKVSNVNISMTGKSEFVEQNGDNYIIAARTRESLLLLDTVECTGNSTFIQWLQAVIKLVRSKQ